MIIRIEEIEKWLKFKNKVNSVPLGEITFTENDKPIQIDSDIIQQFEYIGLNNMDFVDYYRETQR